MLNSCGLDKDNEINQIYNETKQSLQNDKQERIGVSKAI